MKPELAILYEQYAKECWLYAFSLTKDAALAEDLVSEAFYQLVKSLDNLTKDMIKFWLLRVIKNRYLDEQRQKKRWQMTSFEQAKSQVILNSSASPLEQLLHSEKKNRLYQALYLLSAPERELLYLFYFLDWPTKEIATFTNLSLGQVKIKMYRSRQKLKEILQDETTKF
ncbi:MULTISPECIES: RNA polymerase sigma factor [Enterococcus]|uniref:Sigma-70 family RNA polymerase sigma factor n=1 Tax=Enterococcus dispar ATCC 51266 TaxID=1139219 RepID=S0K385_9ENTE|nr:sigma-70 family RNA polymerase sigma factor [Enterococcus dispar]EOT38992.1 hypothetical protein OMK_02474 [Enterococcus dispar ATCC 51266]EOW86107.1 hypothetical protein I569_01430 [Enterococcus dispar ATCC 51266]